MHIDILQPWVTIQGTATTITTIVQEVEGWLDLSGCADIAAWVDVRAVSPASATSSVTLTLESSPTQDEAFFAPVATLRLLAPAAGTTAVLRSVSGAASANPVARWLRWRLSSVLPATSGTWSATFRVRIARSRTPFFTPRAVPGCVGWLRGDLGVTYTGLGNSSIVASWADQAATPSNTLTAVGSPTAAGAWMGVTPGNYLSSSAGGGTPQPGSMLVVAWLGTAETYAATMVTGSVSGEATLAQTASSSTSVTVSSVGGSGNVGVSSLFGGGILQVDWHSSSTSVFQNGAFKGSASAGLGGVVAGQIGGAAGVGFSGWIAEVLIYNNILTPAWRTLLTRYLGGRYAITVP